MPVTPVSGSGMVSVQGSHVVDLSGLEVSFSVSISSFNLVRTSNLINIDSPYVPY